MNSITKSAEDKIGGANEEWQRKSFVLNDDGHQRIGHQLDDGF